MKTYISDLIPRIQRFSQKLDNLTLLTNQHWVVIEDINESKTVYIFRQNNELLISQNGKVEKAKWEYLGHNSLLIDKKEESYLFRHGFFDENILALKIDSKNEYAFLVNESKFEKELNSLARIIEFLDSKYIGSETRRTIKVGDGKLGESKDDSDYLAPKFKEIDSGEETSFFGGVSKKKTIEFDDNVQGEIFIKKKNGHAYFKVKPDGYWLSVQYVYADKDKCINGLHYFLTTGKTLPTGHIGTY